MRTILRTALALAGSAALVLPMVAQAGSPSRTAISGPSPYAACGAGAAPGTTVSPNAEVEPFVAVNPTTVGMKSANFIAVWQQDAWSNGGARGSVAAASLDGGKTWAETTLPFTACAPNPVLDPATGQPFDRAADSWVSVGPDGIAYTTATAGSVGNLDNGVVAASSVDRGWPTVDFTTSRPTFNIESRYM